MIEIRGFNGKLNVDDNPYRIPKDDFVDALNVTRDAQGQGQDMTITNLIGNTLVTDSLPSGVNKVIGNYADRTRNRQYYFTWNSEDYHRISYYDASLDTIVIVMENLTDTGGENVLNFNASFRINHIDIIYRDLQGDLLFWTDGKNPPRKINVKTATTGGYGVILSSYIDVAKEPPSAPPYCVYEDDATITVNNLHNKLFKFKYRFVYDDLEKSVTSAQSAVPIPTDYSAQSSLSDPTKNADIFIAFQTGAENVTKIELLGAESIGNAFSDFFLITVLDKQELSIPSNDVTYFRFYNDQTYNAIPLNESIQPFDNVPQKAFTQSLPNGNVLDYGAITEGYDLIESDYRVTTDYQRSDRYTNSLLFLAYQNAQPAFGSGDIRIIVAGAPLVAFSTLQLNILDNTTPISFNVNGGSFGLSILAVINSIKSQALTAGFTIVSQTSNELVINKADTSIITTINNSYSLYSAFPLFTLTNNSQFAYDWISRYSYGNVYFDEKGRTNGVIYNPQTLFETKIYSENTTTIVGQTSPTSWNLPKQELKIYNRPPIWAKYFEIVRTKNLSKSNFLYWISEATYKDTTASQDGYKYAYISIANLTAYLSANPNIKTLGYEFTPGDRIKFVKLYNSFGNNAQVYTTNKDFEIVDSLTNVELGGIIIKGQVLKIVLPSGLDGTFDFGTSTFANYLIEIYTPSQNFSNSQNIYYEFGERYIVGNAGEANAFHEGMIQNQSEDLIQPAIYEFYKGDDYFRGRLIPTGGQATLDFTPKSGITSTYFPMKSYVTNNSTHNGAYTFNEVPTDSNYQITINTSTAPLTFAITGSITVKSSVNTSAAIIQALRDFTGTGTFLSLGALTAGVETTIPISFSAYSIPAGNTYLGFQLANFNGELVSFQMSLNDGKSIYAGIIDPNFSDNYDSRVNSDGRAWIFNPNARQNYNPVLIRFGGEYQQGTNINNINRFYEENFDVYDRSRGAIRKMFIEGRNQYIFQEFDVGVVTVLTQIVRDTANNPLSAESDRLLNKIVYPYIGQYGIGDVPESFAYGKHAKYFVDSNKGVVCRLSSDGITPLSVLYKMNAFFVAKLAAYKASLNISTPVLGTPTVYGAFDSFTNKYIIALSAISRPSFSQSAYTIVYTESRGPSEGFETFTSYFPENMGDLNNLLITFKNGQLWKHNSATYCNFYGVQYDCYVETVFNDNPVDKKSYLALMETSNAPWYCPSIKSQLNTYGSTPQETQIVEARFVLQEGQYNSAILRDMNSPGGIINGQTMHGNYLIVKFKRDAASTLYYINTVSLNYNNSPLNAR